MDDKLIRCELAQMHCDSRVYGVGSLSSQIETGPHAVQVLDLQASQATFMIGFQGKIFQKDISQDLAAIVSAIWRLTFEFGEIRPDIRGFVVRRAISEAWARWTTLLPTQMVLMGYPPVFLPFAPEEAIMNVAAQIYDQIQAAAKAQAAQAAAQAAQAAEIQAALKTAEDSGITVSRSRHPAPDPVGDILDEGAELAAREQAQVATEEGAPAAPAEVETQAARGPGILVSRSRHSASDL